MRLRYGSQELLKGNTPTLILSVLASGPLHGYGIAREIERLSEQALNLKEGTLYPVLHALEAAGMLASEWVGEADGRRSRVYGLTERGQADLVARQTQWQIFSTAVNRVLSGGNHA